MTVDERNRYYDVVDDLENEALYTAVAVLRMGEPMFVGNNSRLATAAIGYHPETKKIDYLFNQEFFNSLSNADLKFVMVHESLHLLLKHFIHDRGVDHQRWNIACDIVINDLIHKSLCLSYPKGACTGYTFFGVSCANMNVIDVYFKLMNQNVSGYSDAPAGTKPLDSANNTKETKDSPQLGQHIEDRVGKIDMGQLQAQMGEWGGTSWGTQAKGALLQAEARNTYDWSYLMRFLKKTDLEMSETWSKMNKKYVSCYPTLLLPSVQIDKEDKSEVFIAVDTSGSIKHNELGKMLATLRATPKKRVKVTVICFDTEAYEFKGELHGGGGTDFQCIENYLQQRHQPYPKVVAVFTDGCAGRPNVSKPSRWVWFLHKTMHTDDSHIKGIGKIIKLGEEGHANF